MRLRLGLVWVLAEIAVLGAQPAQDLRYAPPVRLSDPAALVGGTAARIELLRSRAEEEDVYGPAAPEAYAEYAAALERVVPRTPEHVRAVERGLMVALRDADAKLAISFADQARALGLLAGRSHEPVSLSGPGAAWVPGGLKALAFVARAKQDSSREQFFVDYCRAVVQHTTTPKRDVAETYLKSLRAYFDSTAELIGSGVARNGGVRLTLVLGDQKARKETQRILGLLGWKINISEHEVTVEPGEDGTFSNRQELGSALGIDEVAMQEALQAQRTFTFTVRGDSAPVIFGEKTWRDEFCRDAFPPGGLAEVFARDPRIAKVYVGVSAIDANTAHVLLSGIGLRTLVEKYADLLFLYASSLASGPEGMLTPGGKQAEAAWLKVLGASSRDSKRFLRALLDKDGGLAFGFYSALAQVDAEHQRFFTQSPSLAQRLYELFRHSQEVGSGIARPAHSGRFSEFMRELPLDSKGHVNWPGSARVWMVAEGGARSLPRALTTFRHVPNTKALAEIEDEILLRVARTRYITQHLTASELDNFVAVARLNRQREQPLEEEAALLLAQYYPEYGTSYPYFAVLTGLTTNDFVRFFELMEAARRLDRTTLNSFLGDWNGLTAILCLSRQSGILQSDQAAILFRGITDRFTKALAAPNLKAALVRASLDSLRAIVAASGHAASSLTADDAIQLLLTRDAPVTSGAESAAGEADASSARLDAIVRVLDLQRITPLEVLYRIYDAVETVAAGRPTYGRALAAIDENRARLLVPEDSGDRYARRLAEAVARLKQKAMVKGVAAAAVARLAEEVLSELGTQVLWTLTGLVYAAYLSPEDLLIRDDPLFVRKHSFESCGQADLGVWPRSHLVSSNRTGGSYICGGFASFAAAAGEVAAIGFPAGMNSQAVVAAQFAAIRGADYRRLRDEDLRLFGLTVRVAREWIVESAGDSSVFDSLTESTLGLLSLSRRRQLLEGIERGDWTTVWDAVTLGDLYFLGRRYLVRNHEDPWHSPVTAALRNLAASNDGSRLDVLGPVQNELDVCGHPRLVEQPPYEQFEHYTWPARIGERAAELKLYIADRMIAAGLPAASFGTVAEPAARALLNAINMADLHDWRSVTSGFDRLGAAQVRDWATKR